MKKKDEIEKAKAPGLDTMTLRDLASLFVLSGLLGHSRAVNTDAAWAVNKADEIADEWVKRRTT
jgi:polysaccharide pyruvyl transferase WcaK-like protein